MGEKQEYLLELNLKVYVQSDKKPSHETIENIVYDNIDPFCEKLQGLK